MTVFDLSQTITAHMPVYPGTESPKLDIACTHEACGFKEMRLSMFSHTGTHIDSPDHIIEGGRSLDSFPASQFIGKAVVIDCRGVKPGEEITLSELLPYSEELSAADFVLFNTGWDKYWGKDEYFGKYSCISQEVIDFILWGEYKGIGIDTIGIDPIGDAALAKHRALFSKNEIINIENLRGLDELPRGLVSFACLPIKVIDSDGCPARAIAWVE